MLNYSDMLKNAGNLYTTLIGGYETAAQQQQAAQQQIQQGYGELDSRIQGAIAGAGTAGSQAIADQYTKSSGAAMQHLVNSGLGNSTVTSGVNRGLAQDFSKAQTALSEQVGNLKAGYLQSIGLAKLGQAGRDYEQNTDLRRQMLGYQQGYQGQLLGYGAQGQGGNAFGGMGRFGSGGGGVSYGGGGGGGSGFGAHTYDPSRMGAGGGYASSGWNPTSGRHPDPEVTVGYGGGGAGGDPGTSEMDMGGYGSWEESAGGQGAADALWQDTGY